MATTDPKFPLSEWNRLILQANITINLLRTYQSNPALSAYSAVFGDFNFSATPLAPPGTKVISYLDPKVRKTWELNGEAGWYVGPAIDRYRCVEIYFPRTRTTRIFDTVTFIPNSIPFPEAKLHDFLIQAALDIIKLLTQPPSTTTPTLKAGDPVRNALLKLATQLERTESFPNPVAISPRVPEKMVHSKQQHIHDVPSPRVKTPASPIIINQNNTLQPIFTLLIHNNQPKNVRFNNKKQHKYDLRSNTKHDPTTFQRYNRHAMRKTTRTPFNKLILQYLAVQKIFKHTVNNIYNANGKKETIDTVLRGNNQNTWEKGLDNE